MGIIKRMIRLTGFPTVISLVLSFVNFSPTPFHKYNYLLFFKNINLLIT